LLDKVVHTAALLTKMVHTAVSLSVLLALVADFPARAASNMAITNAAVTFDTANVLGPEFTLSTPGGGTLSEALAGVPREGTCAACADLQYIPECHVPVCVPAAGYGAVAGSWACSTTPVTVDPVAGTPFACGASGLGRCDLITARPEFYGGSHIGCVTTINVSSMAVGAVGGCAAIAADNRHANLAGKLACWGGKWSWSFMGQGWDLGVDYPENSFRLTVDPVGATLPFVQVVGAWDFFYALDSAGQLFAWGQYGTAPAESGLSGYLKSPTWVDVYAGPGLVDPLPGTDTLVRLCAMNRDSWHVCAVSSAGNVYCWGDNGDDQVGHGPNAYVYFGQVPGVTGAIDLACGYSHTLVALDAAPWVMGWGTNGAFEAIGLSSGGANIVIPAAFDTSNIPGITAVLSLSAAEEVSGAVFEIGGGASPNEAYAWGMFSATQVHATILNPDSAVGATGPSPVHSFNDAVTPDIVKLVMCDSYGTAMLDAEGRVGVANVFGEYGLSGLGTHTNYAFDFPVPLVGPASDISCITDRACAILRDTGELVCWGINDDGQLGGSPAQVKPPSRMPYSHSCGA